MRLGSVAIAVVAAVSGSGVYAQEEAGQFRTAVSAVGGFSVGSSRSFGFADGRFGFEGHGSGSGFAVGGSVAHDFSPRLTMEATGLYLDRNAGAWSADAGLRLNLTPSRSSIVPYFAVSGGLYGDHTDQLVARSHDDDGRRAPASGTGRLPTPGRPGPVPSGPFGRGGFDDRSRIVDVSTESVHSTNGMMTM